MNYSRLLKLVPPLAIALFFTSCSSITPISSKPPYSKIVVNHPFSWGDGVLTIKVNMPAGTYLPKFEDKEVYFYEAPQKITGRDTFLPLLVDGGLYLKRGLNKPDTIYIIRSQTGSPGKVGIGDRAAVTMVK
ncbi:MAG TPA: hypothetical protein VGZ24_01770 [Chthoniobacterales bacterium]|jgi:hypothetical protein|nr:hypothetical protein [Chthoniobacterales bacterium]